MSLLIARIFFYLFLGTSVVAYFNSDDEYYMKNMKTTAEE